jgi:hypothetical protein
VSQPQSVLGIQRAEVLAADSDGKFSVEEATRGWGRKMKGSARYTKKKKKKTRTKAGYHICSFEDYEMGKWETYFQRFDG